MLRYVPVCSVVLVAALGMTEAFADSGVINASAVNLRTEAALQAAVLMKLPYGTPCEVVESAGGWKRVRLADAPSVEGYVSASLVSGVPFSASEEDERIIRAFKAELFAPDSTADIYRHRVDVAAIPPAESTLEYEKRARECLERWLYWDATAPAKYRVWLMDLMERHHTYDRVPIEALRNARALRITPESYVETVETSGVQPIQVPPARPSFFVATPKHFVVAPARRDGGLVAVDRADVVFLQALPLIGGEQRASIHIEKIAGHLAYVSDRPVDFVSVPLAGGAPTLEHATVVFIPGARKFHLKATRDPGVRADPVYVVLAPDSILHRIAACPTITVARSGTPGGTATGVDGRDVAYTTRFDLDGDGVLDLVQTLEACPDEATEPRDLVNYFNVGDRWEPLLFWRTWCRAGAP